MEKTKKNDLPVSSMTKRNDFVEIKFTGYSNGNVFDSNIEEDLKKINPEAKAKEFIVIIGQGMIVPGLDKALEDKEVGKEYNVDISAKDGFGERRKELVKTIPLKIFREKNINPYPGMVLAMDESIARVITVSGARVMTDFNNPLAGKDIKYKFTIVRILVDEKEKVTNLFETIFRFVPEFEIKENVIVTGPQALENFVKAFKNNFMELIGKELEFKLKEEKKEENKEVKAENEAKKE